MELVIGGAYQGKQTYAQQQFNLKRFMDGTVCTLEELACCDGIHHFHMFLKRVMAGEFSDNPIWAFDADVTKMEIFAETLTAYIEDKNPQIVIVSNELGYGVVPMEREDRMWRELCGRVCTCVADKSNSVTRVVCGIGMKLK